MNCCTQSFEVQPEKKLPRITDVEYVILWYIRPSSPRIDLYINMRSCTSIPTLLGSTAIESSQVLNTSETN